MITGTLLGMLAGLWEWVIGGIPAPSPESWMSSVGSAIGWVADTLGGMGAWIPFGVLAGVLATLTVVWGSAVAVRIGLRVLSLFTGGGGR
ncbi:MAG: hypothetical protein WCF36_18990 [Candidatus Nanopelagicales bacterium]